MNSLTIEKTILSPHVSIGMTVQGDVVIKFDGQEQVTSPFEFITQPEPQGMPFPEEMIPPEIEPEVNPQVKPMKVRKGSCVETVTDFMLAHPDEGFSLAELVAIASKVSESAVHIGLKRLIGQGYVEKFSGEAANGRKSKLYRMSS